MDTRIVEVTTSQMKAFKSCRKRYELEYVQQLRPIKTPKALEIGTLYHAGLERLLRGECYPDVEVELTEMHQANAERNGIDYEPLNLYVALEMIAAWNRDSGYKSWQCEKIELPFCVPTGYAKRIKGKIDAVMRHPETKKLYLIEHKTTSQWGKDGTDYIHGLQWDEQSTNYLYAWRIMQLDKDNKDVQETVDGMFYDVIEKPTLKLFTATPLDQRKYTKDGSLYKAQHDHDETPEEFRLRVREWYSESNRCHTHYQYRTDAEITERIADMNQVIRDMVIAEREGTFYRNPFACAILDCPYRPKCLENKPDTDCLFIKKTQKNEELA